MYTKYHLSKARFNKDNEKLSFADIYPSFDNASFVGELLRG